MEKMFNYSVAIRTLGQAGEKYQALLNSINAQSIKPEGIYVYIPHGYALPKETIGWETIVRCDKGMITQRSLAFDEITSDCILFCDDDMYIPPYFAEKCMKTLRNSSADSIVADLYNTNNQSFISRISDFIVNTNTRHWKKDWALTINKDASYSYNSNIKDDFIRTQTGPGGCIFCKKEAFKAMHFEDERWLERFLFPSYEDQLFHYKMFIMGKKVLMYYNSGVIHLDAKSASRPDYTKKMLYKKMILFILWYRTIYNIKKKGIGERLSCTLHFILRNILSLPALLIDTVRMKKINFLWDFFIGLYKGYRYVHSKEYRNIPPFDAYLNM